MTQSVPHFAQEIIDNIIDELSYDEDTLKQCSTVSRSFLVPSRKHLFFTITLFTVKRVVLFHRLLISTPNIAHNVRTLGLRFRQNMGNVGGEGKVVRVKEWFMSSTLLAEVLEMLPCIQKFSWQSFLNLRWDELPSELRSALVKLFQRPSLTAIKLSQFNGFPLSALHIVSPVKRLQFWNVLLHNSDQGQVILPHLESLTIQDDEQLDAVQLIVPSLERISYSEHYTDRPGALAQEAMNASGRTLQWLWWHYNLRPCMYFSDFHMTLMC
jgi:hypothetical protein